MASKDPMPLATTPRFDELLHLLAEEHGKLLQERDRLRRGNENAYDGLRRGSVHSFASSGQSLMQDEQGHEDRLMPLKALASPIASPRLDARSPPGIGGHGSVPSTALDGDSGRVQANGASTSGASNAALPDLHPELWPAWTDQETGDEDRPRSCTSVITQPDHNNVLMENTRLKAFVMTPTSGARSFWDSITAASLSYDIVMLPMLAFYEPEGSAARVLHILTACIWTLDVPMSFFTGYFHLGVVEMKLSRIAWHYIKGWLMLDMGVIMLEWFLLIVEPESISRAVTLARSAKILRLSRFLRLVRFVRLFKFSSRVSYIHAGSFQLQALPTAMGIMRSLVYILVASHYIACAWYLVGGRYKRTWIDMFDEDHHGVPYRYATSLHWSITQFTPASAEVQPRNTLERGFAILVIVLGMVAFSCFISSITQAMGNFQRLRAEELQRTANMRQFFLENQVSFDVGARITRFLQEAATHEKQRHRLHENDLPQLQLLPDSLRSELHLEMYKPILYSHGFFCVAMEADSSCLEEICHHAMAQVNVRHHKDLFEADSEAHSAFYLTSGTGMYTLKYTKETAKVSECQWLVEAALWLQWRHQGTVYAKTSLQGVRLDSAKFRSTAQQKGVRFICMKYAQEYLRLLEAHDSNTQAFMAELGFDADVLDAMVQTICFAQEEETRSRSNELSRISHGSIANAMHELGGRVHHLRSSSSRVFG